MNVLYLISDDMRADWGTYGLPVHTPNIDALAASSLTFEHAYCQISVCSPSRQSFMTSKRPDTNKVWNFIDANPLSTQATPGHFRDAGYLTLGLGKTFHEDNGKWNEDKYWNNTVKPYFPYSVNRCPHGGEGGGQCVLPDDQIWDYKLRLAAVEYLTFAAQNYKKTGTPFFVMAGFRDPHAPWAAPKRMYDLYDESSIALPRSKVLGEGTPLIAWSPELNVCLANGTSFPWGPYKPVPDWVMRNQRHAYYAAVSYVDEHIGAILKVLDEQHVRDDTIVVFHADHGYALGEHGEWEKKSNLDLIVRVPLMIHVPNKTNLPERARKTQALFDLVDVFPTLSSLAGLPPPSDVDGMDQSGLILAPSAAGAGRDAAYHQYPACNTPSFNHTRSACNNTPRNKFNFMGYSIRTATWRYTCWYHWKQDKLEADWDGEYAEELYDHKGDHSTGFDRWDNKNLASERPQVAKELKKKLEAFFRHH